MSLSLDPEDLGLCLLLRVHINLLPKIPGAVASRSQPDRLMRPLPRSGLSDTTLGLEISKWRVFILWKSVNITNQGYVFVSPESHSFRLGRSITNEISGAVLRQPQEDLATKVIVIYEHT